MWEKSDEMDKLKDALNKGLVELYSLWEEIGKSWNTIRPPVFVKTQPNPSPTDNSNQL